MLAVLIVGVVAYPWLRPMLGRDTCHPGGQSNVLDVPLTLCVNPAIWGAIVTMEPGKTSFGNGAEKIYFDSFGQADPIPFEALPKLILNYSKQFATNNEDFSEVKEWTTELGGHTWRAMNFASQTADLVVYYYSDPKFGSAELFFMSFKPQITRRDQLADEILRTVTFTATPKV